jgi:hypothetical protein
VEPPLVLEAVAGKKPAYLPEEFLYWVVLNAVLFGGGGFWVPAVLAVIPVTWVALVVLLFSRFTGFATESFRFTTRLLLIVYLSGDFDSATGWAAWPLFPLVYALLWNAAILSFGDAYCWFCLLIVPCWMVW